VTESSLNEVKIDPATVKGAAGFHRVGKDASGRWWMIDPDDRPWLFKGVCGLNRAGTQGGRLAKPGPYHDAIGRKFGEDPQPFVQACLEKMREAGFNAAGSWVTEEFFDQGLPYTDILECVKLDKSTALRGPTKPLVPIDLDRLVRLHFERTPLLGGKGLARHVIPVHARRRVDDSSDELARLDDRERGLVVEVDRLVILTVRRLGVRALLG